MVSWGLQRAAEHREGFLRADGFFWAEFVASVSSSINCRLHGQPWIRIPKRRIGAAREANARFEKTPAPVEPGLVPILHGFEVCIASFVNEVRLGDNSQRQAGQPFDAVRRRDAGVFDSVKRRTAGGLKNGRCKNKFGSSDAVKSESTPQGVSGANFVNQRGMIWKLVLIQQDFPCTLREFRSVRDRPVFSAHQPKVGLPNSPLPSPLEESNRRGPIVGGGVATACDSVLSQQSAHSI